jgi:hypothetical protein
MIGLRRSRDVFHRNSTIDQHELCYSRDALSNEANLVWTSESYDVTLFVKTRGTRIGLPISKSDVRNNSNSWSNLRQSNASLARKYSLVALVTSLICELGLFLDRYLVPQHQHRQSGHRLRFEELAPETGAISGAERDESVFGPVGIEEALRLEDMGGFPVFCYTMDRSWWVTNKKRE